jgi:hypothetical protein
LLPQFNSPFILNGGLYMGFKISVIWL